MEKEKAKEMCQNSGHKKITVFNVTAMNSDYDAHTNSLVSKLIAYAKEQEMDVSIEMCSASKIDSNGKDTDIILLAPGIASLEGEVKEKFPDKAVRVMDQKDYGFMQAENILKTALS